MENSPLNVIDPAKADINTDCILWPQQPDENFLRSISEYGQLCPVIALEQDGRFRIVAGYKRTLAALKLGIELNVIVIEADPVKCGLIYMQENSGRALNDAMRLSAFRYFSKISDVNFIKDEVAPQLGIKARSKDMKLWLAWLELPEEFDSLLVSGSLPLAVAPILNSLSSEERSTVKPFFANMGWSRSNAVNFLTWLYEFSKYSGKSISELIKENNILPRTEDENPKDAASRLTAQAKSIRYPHLSSLESEFSTLSSAIISGTGWKINSTANFENGDSEISFRIRSRSDLEKALSTLNGVAVSSNWKKLWNLGRED